MITVIISNKDVAGLNIKDKLQNLGLPINIHTVTEDIIYAKDVDQIQSDIFVFGSRHSAKSNNNSFCVHPIGNWHDNNLGGRSNTLCPPAPEIMKFALNQLKKLNTIDYEISMEATHHGPYTSKPAIFIEIGSTRKNWEDDNAGRIIAKVITNLTAAKLKSNKKCLVLGGTHYNHTANKIMLETEYAVSHICPKHALLHLNKTLLDQAMEWSDFIVLDWKGLGKYKDKILTLTKGYDTKKAKEIY